MPNSSPPQNSPELRGSQLRSFTGWITFEVVSRLKIQMPLWTNLEQLA